VPQGAFALNLVAWHTGVPVVQSVVPVVHGVPVLHGAPGEHITHALVALQNIPLPHIEPAGCGPVSLQTAAVGPHAVAPVRHGAAGVQGTPSAVSHPSATAWLQSPNPVAHEPIVHAPATHAPVACAGAQTTPHAPQSPTVLPRSVSHPSVVVPLQSPKPGAQTYEQCPAVHLATSCAGALHCTPQPPQFDGSSCRPAQYAATPPSIRPAHIVSPGVHPTTQCPDTQSCDAGHAAPHEPQFAGSFRVSAQYDVPPSNPPAHMVSAPAQAATQWPATHTSLEPHAVPHDPQFDGSPRTSRQLPQQRICAVGQPVVMQLPVIKPDRSDTRCRTRHSWTDRIACRRRRSRIGSDLQGTRATWPCFHQPCRRARIRKVCGPEQCRAPRTRTKRHE
jgi:hypothetical protein